MIWLAVAGLCAISFLFAGIEAGLLSVDPVGLRHQVKQRTPGARRLARLLEHPGRLLVTVLILTNVADIFALLLATRSLIGSFGRAGYFIAGIAAVPVYLFVLGVLPKALFRRFPIRALGALGGILETASLLLRPILIVGERFGRMFLPRRATNRARLFAAREELKQVAMQSEREGSLTSTERAMIHNVVDFRNLRVRDVMVPLAQCVAVQAGTPVDSILKQSSSAGLDSFPVISPEGQAIGVVNVLDILFDPGKPTLADYTRRIVISAETESAYRIIRRLRAARVNLVAVVNAQRKLVGFATDEALIKRIVQSA